MSYNIQEVVCISGIGKTMPVVKGLFFHVGTRKRIGLGTNTDTDTLHPSLFTCEAEVY